MQTKSLLHLHVWAIKHTSACLYFYYPINNPVRYKTSCFNVKSPRYWLHILLLEILRECNVLCFLLVCAISSFSFASIASLDFLPLQKLNRLRNPLPSSIFTS